MERGLRRFAKAKTLKNSDFKKLLL